MSRISWKIGRIYQTAIGFQMMKMVYIGTRIRWEDTGILPKTVTGFGKSKFGTIGISIIVPVTGILIMMDLVSGMNNIFKRSSVSSNS